MCYVTLKFFSQSHNSLYFVNHSKTIQLLYCLGFTPLPSVHFGELQIPKNVEPISDSGNNVG